MGTRSAPNCDLGQTALKILETVMLEPWLAPSLHDLCAITGKPISSVQMTLHRLRKRGLVQWEDGRCRTLVATCRFIPADDLALSTSQANCGTR